MGLEHVDSESDRAVSALCQRAALAEAQVTAAEAEVEALQRRNERVLGLVSDGERRRAEAEYWLEQHRRSLSWRLTGPVRDLIRRARGRSR